MSELSIQKGIPLPPKSSGWGKFGNTIRLMEIGDSVFVDDKRDVANLMSSGKRIGLGMASRKVDNGWRIWRVK